MVRVFFAVVLAALLVAPASVHCAHSILSAGAVPNTDTDDAATANSLAILTSLMAANNDPHDRTVLVPSGAVFYTFNVSAVALENVTLQVDGTVRLSNSIKSWPVPPSYNTWAGLGFTGCKDMTVTGSGTIDGQGYDWWVGNIIGTVGRRPHLVVFHQTSGLTIEGVTARNSPQYHWLLDDVENVWVHDTRVVVDVVKVKALLQRHGHWDEETSLPTFPLNTDGFDPSGQNMLFERLDINNYDDAVAVKPASGSGRLYGNCTSNITIRDSVVRFGVGMTIGSVPPREAVNCVDGVLFDNITFYHPIKAIYIKTNPGTSGTGIINNITYSNLVAHNSLWYPIWIGPQQQKQPRTAGTGCSFLFPLPGTKCPTQPRVPITNVTVRNATFTGGLTLPGVILCNATRPCENIVFDGVRNTGPFLVQKEYFCENAKGENTGGTSPEATCF